MKSIKIYIIIILVVGTTVGGVIFINKTNKIQKNNQVLSSVDEIISDKDEDKPEKENGTLEIDNSSSSEDSQKKNNASSKDNSKDKNKTNTPSNNITSTQKKENNKSNNATSSNKPNNNSTPKKEQDKNNDSISSNNINNNSTDKKEKKCYPRKISIENTLPPNQITELYRNENVVFDYKLSDYCYYGDDEKIYCGDIGCTSYDDTVNFDVEDSKIKVTINNNSKTLVVNHTYFNSGKVFFKNKMGDEIGAVKFSGRCRPIESITTKITEIKLQANRMPMQAKYVYSSDFSYTGVDNCSRSNLSFDMSIDDTSIANFKSNGIGIYKIWGRKEGTTTGRFKLCVGAGGSCAETTIKIVVYE